MVTAPKSKPEFDLLCCVARPQPALDRVRAYLRLGVDFSELLPLAVQHAVQPQLVDALGLLSWEAVPDDARRSLEAFCHRHLLRVLTFTEALCRVADAFDKGGVTFATFKGVALAHALYGDASAREYSDIDIIVPQQHMMNAERILEGLGYRSRQGDRTFRAAFLSYQRQYALFSRELGFSIDLHWAFSGSYLPFPLAADDVWRDIAYVTVGHRRIPTIGGVNLALLLAGHGTKEQWERLQWVADFALLIDRSPDLDWSAVYRRARDEGCGNCVLLGCLLAEGLLDVPVPSGLLQPIAGNKRVGARAAVLIDGLRQGVPLPDVPANFSDLDLCDRRLDRIGAALSLVVTPTVGDHAALPLPPSLWSIYRVIRPFRLAAKAVARLF